MNVFSVVIYNFNVENNNNNEGQIRQSTVGTLHAVAFVKRINMKEGSAQGERSGQINSLVLICFCKEERALENWSVGRSSQEGGGHQCQGCWPMFSF